MSPQIIEVESVSLPRELRQHRNDEHWVAFSPDGYMSEPVSYSVAIRLANARGGFDTSIGYLVPEEPAAAQVAVSKPDYSSPVPSRLSRKKRAAVPDKTV